MELYRTMLQNIMSLAKKKFAFDPQCESGTPFASALAIISILTASNLSFTIDTSRLSQWKIAVCTKLDCEQMKAEMYYPSEPILARGALKMFQDYPSEILGSLIGNNGLDIYKNYEE